MAQLPRPEHCTVFMGRNYADGNCWRGDAVARLPGDLAGTGQPSLSRRYDVSLGIAAFELDFWGRVSSLRDAALASFLATEQAYRSFRLVLIADVVDAYLAQRESVQRLALARDTLRARTESLVLVKKRQEAGLASDRYLSADGALRLPRRYRGTRASARGCHNSMRLLVGCFRMTCR
jgi:multidrug efflux system outer membrane protein